MSTGEVFLHTAQAFLPRLVELRRDFHRHPELSNAEHRTQARVADELRGLGVEVQTGVGGTGVVGVLDPTGEAAGESRGGAGSPRPCVALRADMDALPIQEENDVPYRSQVPGVMHACGHDFHMAALLGAAMLLAARREALPGPVKFIFQPSEETVSGARRMIEDGVLDAPPVDAIFGFHNVPLLPAGQVALKEGPTMAAVDTVHIDVVGAGGHGGIPQRTVDPIVAASALVLALQTVVSRGVDPLEAAVVTIGSFQAGTASNIIPDRAQLAGTVRTFNPAVRDLAEAAIRRVAEATVAAFGARAEVRYERVVPAVRNEAVMTRIARQAAAGLLGDEAIREAQMTTGGEDFALFLERVPGCYLSIGSGDPEGGPVAPWHSSRYQVNESALAVAAAVMARTALLALKELRRA